jgi:hypothetical protein
MKDLFSSGPSAKPAVITPVDPFTKGWVHMHAAQHKMQAENCFLAL